ncbi:alpha/beta-hydrolase [Naematelia encephala]|uniref:carboxypeptidase C n=1 Tax=Naematelia encephala TaxID=71784 RepID=A0A1Y2APN8_9TREE|nr:alpha/beta-hydrolase [Naematelia encephala]
MSNAQETTPLLGEEAGKPTKRYGWHYVLAGVAFVLVTAAVIVSVVLSVRHSPKAYAPGSFFVNITKAPSFCDAPATAWTGHIGLTGDTEESPKRSFFWYVEAEKKPETAPMVLTVGGGPGTSGLTRMWLGDGPCIISQEEKRAVSNPDRWTKEFNYLAIDHPVGVGFSYGQMVNSSADAARDIYDFLQRFYSLHPDLQKNDLILNGGSYGGMYLPHMAHEINEQNKLLALGKAKSGTKHINLESIMISNPMLDPISHITGLPLSMCKYHQIWNETECTELYEAVPSIIELMRRAVASPTLEHKIPALHAMGHWEAKDLHGVSRENLRSRCNGQLVDCHPRLPLTADLLNSVKSSLGIPEFLNFTAWKPEIAELFDANGDMMQDSTRFFPQLLKDGIRILHRVGMLDLNCAWPGVLSALKRVPTPYQDEFINAADIPWPGEETEATFRVIGQGAGEFTYVQLHNAGHFVGADAPRMELKLAQHWIYNKAFDQTDLSD